MITDYRSENIVIIKAFKIVVSDFSNPESPVELASLDVNDFTTYSITQSNLYENYFIVGSSQGYLMLLEILDDY